MKKILLMALLLFSAYAINVTVSCSGPCLAYLPVNGHAELNYTVDGRQLGGIFPKSFELTLNGTEKNTFIILDQSAYGCNSPAKVFNNTEVSSYSSDGFLVFRHNVSSTNSTVKIFCDGYGPEPGQPDWFYSEAPTVDSFSNLTIHDGQYVVSGFSTVNSTLLSFNATHQLSAGRGNFSVVEATPDWFNMTFYDYSTLSYLDYVQVQKNQTSVDLAYGWINTTYNGSFVWAVSHGNISIVNETNFEVDTTITNFTSTRGIAIANVSGGGYKEIVVCGDIDGSDKIHRIHWEPNKWVFNSTAECTFDELEPFQTDGYNQSVVGINSTSIAFIMFNQSYLPDIFVYNTVATDIAVMDVDSDGRDEILLTDSSGHLRIYRVNLSASRIIEEADYVGDFDATASTTNGPDLLLYNGDLVQLNTSGFAGGNASLTMQFENSRPLAIHMNMTLTGHGNISADLQVGDWTNQTNLTAPASQNLIFYPGTNGTLQINLTFTGYNSSWDVALDMNITINGLNISKGNATNYTAFTPVSFSPNTTLLANLNYTLVAANFTDATHLRSVWIYLPQSGTLELELNSSTGEKWFWKPTISPTVSTYKYGQGAVQASQAESNFTAPVMLNTSFVILPQNITYNAYGVLNDLCAYKEYILAVWGNATLYKWIGSSLSEIGNFTPGSLEQCWLADKVYVMNSSGGLRIYNYSLGMENSFVNSSFVLQDFFVEATESYTLRGWNGTDVALLNLTSKHFTLAGGKDFVFNSPSQILSGSTVNLWGENEVKVHNAFGLDWMMDKIWEIVNKGIWIIRETFSKIVNLPWGVYSGFMNNITIGFTNGTVYNYEFNLQTPSIGSINNFVVNQTYTGDYIAMNYSDTLQINMTDSGYYHNETDSLVGFNMSCKNATTTLDYEFTKGYYHNFTLTTKILPGVFECEVFPTWEVPLPKTMGKKAFALYSDNADPVVNNVTTPAHISSDFAFNVTVNVTEDTRISNFSIYTNKGTASVLNFWKTASEPYQIFTVKVKIVHTVTHYGENVSVNMSATDVVGRTSPQSAPTEVFIYNSAEPSIIAPVPDPRFGLESEPINVNIAVSSDANLSYVNATLWTGSVLDSYEEQTSICGNTTSLWFNRTGLSSENEFKLWINATDITGNTNTITRTFKRYPNQTISITGHWIDAPTSSVTYTWKESYLDTSGNAYTYVYNTSDSNPATIGILNIEVPNTAVTKINLRNTASQQYVELKWDDVAPTNLEEYFQKDGWIYGLNISVAPDNVYIRVVGYSVGSGERMLLQRCDNFTVSSMNCGDSWDTIKYATQGSTSNTFSINKDDVNDWLAGVGFKITKETVSEETTDEEEDTTTTTIPAGTASITLTRPSSKTINVGECDVARFTISNVGTASASITGATATGFTSDEMTFTVVSPPSFPITVTPDTSKNLDLSFCPIVAGTYNAQVCIVVSGSNICKTLSVTGVNASTTTEIETAEENKTYENLKMKVEDQDGVFVVTVDSDDGPVPDAIIQVTYPDGTVENYTTNSFGKASFTPLDEKFTIKIFHGDETLQKRINTSASRLSLGRVLIDLLILAIIMGIGIFLDEKLM